MRWKTAFKAISACVLLGPCALCVGYNASRMPEKQRLDAERIARAEGIVAAVRAYEQQHGALPEGLKVLEPRFVADLRVERDVLPGLHYESGETDFAVEFLESPLGTLHGEGYHRYRSSTGRWDFYLP